MKKLLIALMPIWLAGQQVMAQCDACPPSDKRIDYCFTMSDLPGKCAQFTTEGDMFYFSSSSKARKAKPIALPGTTDTEGMIEFARKNKKLKTEDILFIQAAVNKWNQEKIDLGYKYTPSGLGYKVLKEGNGPKPQPGNRVTVHYRGSLKNGSVFDSSFDRNQPVTFPIGVGQLIRGWDEGIPMFNEGSRIMLRIPPELGYGQRSTGSIPPNSVLYFEIEILKANAN
jgi:FKBP-type peptidyl-prolyl cis-trans isomerase